MTKREQIIDIMNKVALYDMTEKERFTAITSEDDMISILGLDSFDWIMWYLYLGEEFGIEQGVFDENLPRENIPVKTVLDFIEKYETYDWDYEALAIKYGTPKAQRIVKAPSPEKLQKQTEKVVKKDKEKKKDKKKDKEKKKDKKKDK